MWQEWYTVCVAILVFRTPCCVFFPCLHWGKIAIQVDENIGVINTQAVVFQCRCWKFRRFQVFKVLRDTAFALSDNVVYFLLWLIFCWKNYYCCGWRDVHVTFDWMSEMWACCGPEYICRLGAWFTGRPIFVPTGILGTKYRCYDLVDYAALFRWLVRFYIMTN